MIAIDNMNKFGECPNPECKADWDGGDILENLKKLSAFINKSNVEIEKIALDSYGYDEQHKKHFSKVIIIHVSTGRIVYKCPHCGSVYNAQTGERFSSLYEEATRHEQDNRYFSDRNKEQTT